MLSQAIAFKQMLGWGAPATDTERTLLLRSYIQHLRTTLDKLSHLGVIHQNVRDATATLMSRK